MEAQVVDFIFQIAILVMSIVMHEVSHGFMAYALGDPTAKYEGRLTLNPIPHIDPFGSLILPVLSYMLGGIIFGWAKPVPYNPYNLKNQKWGPALVAGIGPFTNLFIALVFGIAIRIASGMDGQFAASFTEIALIIVVINIVLAVFNFVPIPPLDGSKVLFAFLPYRFRYVQEMLEQYGFMLLLIFVLFLFPVLSPIIDLLLQLFTGFRF